MHKLSVSLILVVFTAAVGLGWAIDQYVESFREDSVNDIVDSYTSVGANLSRALDGMDRPDEFVNRWNQHGHNSITLTPTDAFPLPNELEKDFFAGEPLVLESKDKLSLHYYLHDKHRVLTFNPEELAQPHTAPLVNLLLTGLFYVGLLMFLLIWLIPLNSRLIALRNTAKEFGAGHLAKRIHIPKTSYIADIEVEFNRMASRIESLIADNKLISSAVSHDLRTPLSRIRLGVDVLSETKDVVEIEKYQKRLDQDLDEMQSLIESLLAYAKLEPSLIEIEKKPIDLFEFVSACCQTWSDEAKQCVISGSAQPAPIFGDAKYLNMVVKNLLNNAVRHAEERVLVEFGRDATHAWVCIHDDGCGIDESIRACVLKPFIKYGSNGHGMGLAIVERIAQWHHATVDISHSEKLGGALIRLTFPVMELN